MSLSPSHLPWLLLGAIGILVFVRLRRWSISYSAEILKELEPYANPLPSQPIAKNSSVVLSLLDINKQIIREQIDTLPVHPSDRIESLINDLAWTRLQRELEGIYHEIFLSQLCFLRVLNQTPFAKRSEAEKFFDGLAEENAELRKIPFANWLQFLVAKGLVSSSDTGLSIATLGQEFLVWMIRNQKPDKPHERF